MESDNPGSMRRVRRSRVWSMLLGCLLTAATGVSQDTQNVQPPAPTPTPAPTPIPASQIPAAVGEVAAVLRVIEANAGPQDQGIQIADALPAVKKVVGSLESDSLPLLKDDGPPQELKETDIEIARIARRLDGWLGTLKGRTDALDRNLDELVRRKQLWLLTRDEAGAADLPAALVVQVKETLRAIERVETTVRGRRTDLLTLQAEVAELQSRLQALSDQLRSEIRARQENLLRFDSPPLWRAAGQPRSGDLGGQVVETGKRNLVALETFARENIRGVVQNLIVLTILIALFVRLGRKAGLWVRSDASLRTTAALLQRPVASSLLIYFGLLDIGIYSTVPTALLNLSGLVLLLVMLRLLPFLVRSEMRPAIGMLVALVALYLVVDLIPDPFFLHRAGELLLAVLGAATCGWVLHRERSLTGVRKDFWYWAPVSLAAAAAGLFSISVLANIFGAVSLSSLLATATLASIYDTIVVWIFVVVVDGAMTVALRTTTARRLLIVRYHSDRILAVVFRVIRTVAVLTWAVFTLDHFGLLDRIASWLKAIVLFEFHLGGFSLSVSSVALFAVTIWVSVKLSQLIGFILDEDVMPRLDLPKGVPATISKTSTYLILAIGFFIAVTAAGVDLSQATIVVGALGVGIGFGLQNTVNNFVSGLILLFGRPINVGDKIQIGEVSGVVKDIGIRATIVHTWQGAEVIVPNATLISDNLVNWTLSDQNRRMEIPVGVAYGSPTTTVIELLTGVAMAHPEVLEDPAPVTIFTGFGDSSLDFELRAWTMGDFVSIASDLRVGIERVLADNGIAIPFPQRDVHLVQADDRTPDPAAVATSAGSAVIDGDASSTSSPESDESEDTGGGKG